MAKTTDNNELKTEYIKNCSFNDSHFKDMIISYLRSFGGATRGELNTLLSSKLSDVLTDEQKIRKIGNLLSALKKDGTIQLSEKKRWVLVEVLVKLRLNKSVKRTSSDIYIFYVR